MGLSGFSNVAGAAFGILGDISNFGPLAPTEGFNVNFNTANAASGGSVQLVSGGATTSLNGFDFGLDSEGASGSIDLESDPMRVTYGITSDGAGKFELTTFEILNQETNIVTPLPIGSTFAFVDAPFYSQGLALNGVKNLRGVPQASDFEFSVGNSDSPDLWSSAPEPASITVRSGDGVGSTGRVMILWSDGDISGEWLQVQVLPTASTNLTVADVFYFGNAIGESGNSEINAVVDLVDVGLTRN